MRWDSLFSDLETQFLAERALDREAEITERARVELAGIELGDRLRGAAGTQIKVELVDGSAIKGVLSHVGSEWLVLTEGIRQWLVPCPAVLRYQGLGRLAMPAPSRMRLALGMAAAMRALARDRTELVVHLAAKTENGSKLQGVIDRVGRDHFDLAVVPHGEVRRAGNVAAVMTIPFGSLAALSSAAGNDFQGGSY
ncbi:hypothetical protein SAMN04487912_102285 [Arthrobacter sp. cf158]|uniref:hypothetical protein n=1 Tax=Arthrobacter sp. cf158 TaxID=1761744 RepID=UPI0008962101|nr:hypothetical protein [Arthrobacter sp. cf158]SDW31408.1 hypothetical protein SAMN04487912_102285 [Arthrobacter sp. cf158]